MFRSLAAAAALALVAGAASAQTYPSKPIRMIVPFPPGGGTDNVTRLVSQKLADQTKWTVVVENKPGASGTTGLIEASRANADGYDIVMGQADNLVIALAIQKNIQLDPLKDLTPIAQVATSPNLILARADSPWKNLSDAINAAKSGGKPVTYGSAGHGTFPQLAIELLQTAGNFKWQEIPYKGASPAIADLIGGHIDLAALSISSGMPHIQGGKLKAIAITGLKRSPVLPDVPTVAEQGFPNFEAAGWLGVLGPKNMPPAVVAQLNKEINAVMQNAEVRKALLAQGVEALTGTPEDFAAKIRSETTKWHKVVSDAGIKPE